MDHMDHAAMGHDMKPMAPKQDAFYAPNSGLIPTAYNGGKFLSYSDLKAVRPVYDERPVDREVTVRLTGNMERYIWSMNGETFDDAEPFRFREGERIRFTFVNETMMTHPMHLHGMWMILDNGQGKYRPAKHVIQVAPAMTVSAEVEIDATGHWPFHCHLVYHMHSGMMRRVIVEPANGEVSPAAPAPTHPAMHHQMHMGSGQ
jgi:L-ascorbate oxidase